MIDLYVYADESGVFDKKHNDTFVYGGIIFTDLQAKALAERQFSAMEKNLRKKQKYKNLPELKASKIEPQDKRRLFSSVSNGYRFAVVIKQKRLSDKIFSDSKSKERYLDYAFKIGLKEAILKLISIGEIQHDDEVVFHIDVDEHSTATNGLYCLEEGILREFRDGTISFAYATFFPPILPNTKKVEVRYRQSEKVSLIRTADIIANRVYSAYRAGSSCHDNLLEDFISIKFLP